VLHKSNMNLRQYILIFIFGTLIAWSAWIIVLLNIDPISSGLPALIIFYITLFAGLMGFFITISTVIRAYRFKERELEDIIIISLRQSLMLTILLEGALVLLSIEKLNYLSIGLIISLLAVIEFTALTFKHGRKHTH